MKDIFSKAIEKLPSVDYGIDGLFVRKEHTQNATYYFVYATKDVKFPKHSHAEQFTSVINGKCKLTIDGKTKCYQKGDTYIIPANTEHEIMLYAGYAEIDVVDDPNDAK